MKAFYLGLKGSLMLYVLGSILFIASSVIAIAVILTQIARYKQLAVAALRSLSMDGLPSKQMPNQPVAANATVGRFNLQPARLSLKPQVSV